MHMSLSGIFLSIFIANLLSFDLGAHYRVFKFSEKFSVWLNACGAMVSFHIAMHFLSLSDPGQGCIRDP